MKMTNKQPKQHRSQISFAFCCCSFSQKVKNKNYLFKLFVSVVVEEFFFSCYCFQLEIAYNYLAFFVHDTPPKNVDESTHAFDLNTLIWYPLLCCCCCFPSSRLLSSNACLGEWYQPTLMLLCINLIILLWTKKRVFFYSSWFCFHLMTLWMQAKKRLSLQPVREMQIMILFMFDMNI